MKNQYIEYLSSEELRGRNHGRPPISYDPNDSKNAISLLSKLMDKIDVNEDIELVRYERDGDVITFDSTQIINKTFDKREYEIIINYFKDRLPVTSVYGDYIIQKYYDEDKNKILELSFETLDDYPNKKHFKIAKII